MTILSHSTHDLSPLFANSASLHVVFMLLPLLSHEQRKRHGEILRQIASLVDSGNLKPLVIHGSFLLMKLAERMITSLGMRKWRWFFITADID